MSNPKRLTNEQIKHLLTLQQQDIKVSSPNTSGGIGLSVHYSVCQELGLTDEQLKGCKPTNKVPLYIPKQQVFELGVSTLLNMNTGDN